MTAEELLRSLETQTHTQRVRAMIELGRQGGDDESRAILTELAQGGFYQRFLALHSCFGSRDSAHVIRALADPSRIIRGLAARLTPLVCENAEMQQALDATPSAVRPALLWKLRKQHRQDTIDAFLERPGIGNDAGFCAVLPFGSPDLVARLAPQFVEHAKPDEWQRLARLHPTLVIQLLVRQADTATARDALLLDRVNTLLPMLAKAQPRRALALIVALQRTVPLTSITIRPLVQPLPAAVADLVLAETERINAISLGDHAHQLSTEQLVALYQNHRYTLGWQTDWFSQLPPERRLEAFTALGRLLQQGNKVPSEIVAALPQEQREREARRHVAMTWPSPYSRLTYAEYLPWDEMLAVIDPYLHTSDVGLRQAALRVLIAAVTYHRSRLGEVLGMLQTRRTEQDATRRTMLEGLGAVPLSAWRSEHLPEVEEVIRHGLNDVGLSPITLQYMLDLLLRLLPVYPEWAAPQIATVLRERGWTSSGSSTVTLPSAVELRLTQALLPLFTLWLERDEEASVLGASESWAQRPESFVLALPTIEELLGRTRTRKHAQRALALITKRAHQRLDAMVPALLAEDASWITFDEISSYLLRRRQDLLTPFLSLQPSEGRWGSGRTRSLLPLSAPFAGGTASQQEQLAEALLTIIADETQESRTTTRAVKMLAFLPAVAPMRVAALADDPRSVVRTTALFALGRLDTNGGLQTLLLALRDARARIAIHALRPYLLEMPPEQALANLRAVPLERVTVAKEVIRLIGELAPDAALDELLAFERRDLHRDVRVALIRTLGKYLDRPEAWVVLDRAARSTEPELALAPLSISTLTAWQLADRQGPEIIQRVLRLAAVLIDHPEREVRLEALSYCSRLEAPDDEQVLVPRLAVLARATGSKRQDEEAEAAAKALLGVCSNQDAQLVGQLLHDFLPNRQRLEDIVGSLKGGRRARERALLPVIRATLAALAEDPITTKLCIELAVPNVPWEELAAYFGELARTNELHADALARASEMLLYENTRFSAAQLESFEAALAASDDERVRRLAFSVLMAQTRKASTWSDAHLARLQVYRADPSTLVAAAAQFTFPNEEDDDDFDDDYDDDDY